MSLKNKYRRRIYSTIFNFKRHRTFRSYTASRTESGEPESHFGDAGKCRRNADVHDVRESEDGVIEQVEKLHPKLEPVLLPNLKLLVYDEVPVLLERSAPGIPRSVAVSGRSSSSCEWHVGGPRESTPD